MIKIVVIGNAGGGKSILCSQLSKKLDIPVYQLDKLQWNPGWIPTPEAEFRKKHDDILNRDSWIIDGFASWESIIKRFEYADTIIFVDHNLLIHYWWALKRQFWCLFRPRPNFVEGCPMIPMTGKLLRMIWSIHRDIRPKLIEVLKKYKTKKIIHIKSPGELRKFLSTIY